MRPGISAYVDRRVPAALLAALLAVLLVLLMMSLAQVGSEAVPASKDSVRTGSLVLGVDGGNTSCQGECSGGTGGDSIGGIGAAGLGGSSVPGSDGQAGTPGTAGLMGAEGTPGTPGSQANPSLSEESNGDSVPEGPAATVAPDQFAPVTPESTLPPPEAPPPACAVGDVLGLGSLLAPLADLLKLLNLC